MMKKIARLVASIGYAVVILAGSSSAYAWMGPLDTIDGPYSAGPGYGWGYPGFDSGRPWDGYSPVLFHPTYRWLGTTNEPGRPWRAYRYPTGYPGYGWGAPGPGGYPGQYGFPFPGAIYPIIKDD